ncbi:hypothetical protein HFO74_27165 [Rhizobium laguerreae]|uniref:Uncharacterized protein n=1 Tax=Rhizobium laguerreae TaxID=1076926 RepID=A0AB35FLZ0_9HYPH|nr:hypothetical protein [Rhizobium laguerreae]MBY3067058.1 hypothetical protein [Rhizobium laguerreae]MBY3080057.1 hypothetical protein [Rhizobium laguerreae]
MNSRISALPPIDPWLASSLLQKAIRRGEIDLAQDAVAKLYRLRGNLVWRRLTLIAFEDIGIGDVDLIAEVTKLSTDQHLRRNVGTDAEIISSLVKRMAEAPKCREPDFLICTAKQAPAHEALRCRVAGLSLAERVSLALSPEEQLVSRSVATWMASGINGGGPITLHEGDLPGLMSGFEKLGLPHPLSSAVAAASGKTKEPIVAMVPLLWAAIKQAGEELTVIKDQLPPSISCRGVPSYAFDKHTRLGKHAVAQLLRENNTVRDCVSDYVPEFRARDMVEMAAFYADAVALDRRVTWTQSVGLEALGIETDMTKIGCPVEGVLPITNVVRNNLDHLNDIRQRLFSSKGLEAAQRTLPLTRGAKP